MSNAKPVNIPLNLRAHIDNSMTNNNTLSLIDIVVAEKKTQNNTAVKYLKKQRERAATERLPDFERETRDEISALRADNQRLNTLITITNVLLLIVIVLGVALCLL